ncbi:hypothetical protein DSL72_003228 [Monilinia vaccinii-corymbosi]|uniref:Uncharacterized protein n=1 Tax=Monilinia vaccinii-corymbosi TaxID=61207 RepID=A0A8A3P0M0_9HELO|nr:hypothetical protein DSL72_003228 [Monilinia vaccinii-corymbosi]
MDTITATRHQTLTPSTTPSNNPLPTPFTACIIGASYGIGEHIAYSYARAGASGLILASRSPADLELVAHKVRALCTAQTRIEIFPCDITSASEIRDLGLFVRQAFGRLDVCVANCGYASPVTEQVTDGDPACFRRNFDVNMMGTYHCARSLIPLLLESEGGAKGFIQIGSLASNLVDGAIANPAYCVSKFAQSRFVETLAKQFEERGLMAVVVHPGAVPTKRAIGSTPDGFLDYLVDSVDLCGGFCVWLSRNIKDLKWLNGRFLEAKWDVDELLGRKDEIVEKDLLKWTLKTS